MVEKFDPHNNKEKWEKWKSLNHSGISGISDYNSDIILKYLNDMELGINISITNKKGSRSGQEGRMPPSSKVPSWHFGGTLCSSFEHVYYYNCKSWFLFINIVEMGVMDNHPNKLRKCAVVL